MRARRPALLVLLAVFAAVMVWAEEKEGGKPVAAPTEPDAIAAAKRDFEALKSSRAAADQLRLDSLSLRPLELRGPGETAPVLAMPRDAAAKKLKAGPGAQDGNWLVDAMTRKEATRAAGREGGRPTTGKEETDAEPVSPTEGPVNREKIGEELRPDPTIPMAAAANPLANYLSAWMTPGDLALLKPALSAGSINAGRNEAPVFVREAAWAGLGGAGASPLSPALVAAAPSNIPRPNPYLQDVVPSPPGALFSLPAGPAINGEAAQHAPPSAAGPAPRDAAGVPKDLGKPREEEKYFKQLKRF